MGQLESGLESWYTLEWPSGERLGPESTSKGREPDGWRAAVRSPKSACMAPWSHNTDDPAF